MELYAIDQSTILNNRYEILSLIGTGGFSIIYKAYDHELNSTVAIKEYFPNTIAERIPYSKDVLTRNREAAERFQQGLRSFKEEAHRMAKLNGLHNTVNVLGTFDENHTSYIVMELLEGTSLLAYLKSLPNSRFNDVDDAKQIIRSVAEALDYAHSKKILHRDVSPDNIFLCNDGKVKLIDFGAAREFTEDGELSVVVKTGCTPPEQYRKNGKQGPWTDLYALGATFYRMLTGVYPEAAPDRADNKNECSPPSSINADVPEYIDALILRCLAYDHTLRIAKASDVMDVLSRETVIPLPGVVRAKQKMIRTVSYGMLAACLVLFLTISLIVLKKSETLYNIKIDKCDITMEIPAEFTSESGLAAIKEDFKSIYPQVDIAFVTAGTDTLTADVFIYEDDTECSSLEEIQKLNEAADMYSVTVAYDTDLVYWNVEKAFHSAVDMNNIRSADDILPEYYADNYEEFLDGTNDLCAYRDSITLYRDVQEELPGMYRIYSAATELRPVRFSVASGITENKKNAAMRFLLYLMSERAQEIMFVNHEGLIPAENNQYDHFLEIYSELAFVKHTEME